MGSDHIIFLEASNVQVWPIVLKKSALARCLSRLDALLRGRPPSCRPGLGSYRHQLRHFPEVLGGGCEEELVAGAAWPS